MASPMPTPRASGYTAKSRSRPRSEPSSRALHDDNAVAQHDAVEFADHSHAIGFGNSLLKSLRRCCETQFPVGEDGSSPLVLQWGR